MSWSLAEFMDELARRVAEASLPARPHNECFEIAEMAAELAAEMGVDAVVEVGSGRRRPGGLITRGCGLEIRSFTHGIGLPPGTIEIEATPISPNFRDATGAALARGSPMRCGRGRAAPRIGGD